MKILDLFLDITFHFHRIFAKPVTRNTKAYEFLVQFLLEKKTCKLICIERNTLIPSNIYDFLYRGFSALERMNLVQMKECLNTHV